jgi:hypothetical protein
MLKRHLGQLRVAMAAAALMAAACVPAASRNPAPGVLPPGFDARTVEVRSAWTGGAGAPPVAWALLLQRQGDTYTFTGTTEKSVGGTKAGPLPITVPDSVMRKFLRTLASTPYRPGVYATIHSHTDDYPSITMTLRSGAGVVEIFSDSHSRQNWRITIGGQQHVSSSPVPFDAQAYLSPFYRYEELDRILRAQGAKE